MWRRDTPHCTPSYLLCSQEWRENLEADLTPKHWAQTQFHFNPLILTFLFCFSQLVLPPSLFIFLNPPFPFLYRKTVWICHWKHGCVVHINDFRTNVKHCFKWFQVLETNMNFIFLIFKSVILVSLPATAVDGYLNWLMFAYCYTYIVMLLMNCCCMQCLKRLLYAIMP